MAVIAIIKCIVNMLYCFSIMLYTVDTFITDTHNNTHDEYKMYSFNRLCINYCTGTHIFATPLIISFPSTCVFLFLFIYSVFCT